ncbi:hypothetical protein G6F57_010938 [Rhizopus arrhizus]|nr:hypothetical protein G6F24_011046 [Rhizopus arrhizus]KAG0982480.1 hypothetical protein G6F28_011182 [Rhizopus arrhizus]KAG1062791.1 hypothetical protein G6F41_011274 [Rhizopus arrhizus]KAG1088939.1 hypothetical protein G6F39_011325 [Rhizopus arrhizus]KAG1472688.1 hypothetical protein G6F57_010938 [Rhizopus arrhizus]
MKLFVIASFALSAIGLAQAAGRSSESCRETYTVKPEDTCQSIASKHDITKDNLVSWTSEFSTQLDCNNIKQGDVICVKRPASHNKRDVHRKKPAPPEDDDDDLPSDDEDDEPRHDKRDVHRKHPAPPEDDDDDLPSDDEEAHSEDDDRN